MQKKCKLMFCVMKTSNRLVHHLKSELIVGDVYKSLEIVRLLSSLYEADRIKKATRPSGFFVAHCARDSGGIRTHDPQLRRLLLYPTELRNQSYFRCRSGNQYSAPSLKLCKSNTKFPICKISHCRIVEIASL